MPFKKGESGNPAGRPRGHVKVLEWRQKAAEWCDAHGWDALFELAQQRGGRDRYRALELLFAYGYGRPTQPISGDVDPEAPSIKVTVTFDKPEDNQD